MQGGLQAMASSLLLTYTSRGKGEVTQKWVVSRNKACVCRRPSPNRRQLREKAWALHAALCGSAPLRRGFGVGGCSLVVRNICKSLPTKGKHRNSGPFICPFHLSIPGVLLPRKTALRDTFCWIKRPQVLCPGNSSSAAFMRLLSGWGLTSKVSEAVCYSPSICFGKPWS